MKFLTLLKFKPLPPPPDPNMMIRINEAAKAWIKTHLADGWLDCAYNVVQRVIGTGTMKGAFQGMPPSGKSATWSEIHIVRFANGKVVEHWANIDQLGMLTQLGFIQPPPQS